MKLTKVVTGISAVTLSALLLTACSAQSSSKDSTDSKDKSSQTSKSSKKTETKEATKVAGGDLQDGTYKLEETGYYNGYRAVLSMTVKDGKISKTSYDYVDKDGKSKKDDKEYNKTMKEKSGVGPSEYIPELEKAWKQNGVNISSIETVSGATHSSDSFKNYAQQLVQAAQAGNTDTIKIENEAKMQDGTYSLEEKNEKNGYRATLAITVAGGKITKTDFDYIDKDGKSKTEDEEYEKNMQKVNNIGPKEYIPQLAESLTKSGGDISKVEVVSGATHTSHSFLLYAEQLMNAAQAGNTDKITVDNYVFKD
ncbi:hypothetical protein FC62_GL001335 [Amylolactobacillus amylotrophicus DSM 20534]|uniref:FMN-binding protein n=3 Tax=Amylolactobacillus TaxID=2767876 RepID=A0A1L6XAV7_9LACO|nr:MULTISPECIES: extracellular electron transfer flavoprotein PplA [Amylolactobacillus]APT18110.1 FMN-binding protein [Amylolactobacillus amylophilus DSM 20533 = JCM 1125]KRK37457.1 hypothetical protein FC62_GL001335 [Amylolactobacillus amylotrophicus DSM 20534]KRM42130.1 hypothetical protein FD40_GL000914 [Amylolactobacillus amylophilus DSM 20533 = JCM 1125]GED80529.1 FMN-binding domain-containing protein [Amylolactobacillus amylophilus]